MTLLSPWWLLCLPAVAAVAVWSLLRPARRMAVVGSLALWRQALDSLSSVQRAARRVSASWLTLLAGATLAVLAMAGPVMQRGVAVRRIAVAVYPSAEIATDTAMARLSAATAGLLSRLAEHDQVQLVLPGVSGGAGGWSSPAEARRAISELPPLPVAAESLALPPPAEEAAHVYRFAPACLQLPARPRESVVEIATDLPAATLDALAAEPVGEGSQLLAALRNQLGVPWEGSLSVGVWASADSQPRWLPPERVSLAAGERRPFILDLPPAAAMAVRVADGSGRAVETGFLARRDATVRKVAIVGRDDPFIRRFVRVDPSLELVAEAADADVVVACAAEPPRGLPALEIDPPADPPGWRRANEPLRAIVLAGADADPDDPVMRHVDLSGVAVREVAPWIPAGATAQKRLVSYEGDVLIGRNAPESVGAAEPRRVYVAFDIASENTNFPTTEAFVVFLANATRWLAPGGGQAGYGCLTPLQAGRPDGWTRIDAETATRGGSLAWPGLYRTSGGELFAVSLSGLRPAEPAVPPERAAADAPLPEPARGRQPVELWPALAIAALLCWLAGAAMRARGI